MPSLAYRRSATVALVLGAVLVASIFVIVPSLTLNAADEPPRRILALDSKRYFPSTENEQVTMSAVKAGDLQPNSFVWFLDPYGKTMGELDEGSSLSLTLDRKGLGIFERRDAFENYLLIRLPQWLGGANNDASSFRAYHAISLSDNCLFRYWSTESRWRMENPCAGDIYRPWDGLAVGGPAAVGYVGGTISTGYHPALQTLRLAVDAEGYLVAYKPDNSLQGDGIRGEGRRLSPQDVDESNRKMIQAANEHAGYSLPFPLGISSDYRLSELNPATGPYWMKSMGPEPPIQAAYSNLREYATVTIDVYPMKKYPGLRLGGPLSSPSGDSGYLVNGTLVSALIHGALYRPPDLPEPQFRNGTDVAGDYAILVAPAERSDDYSGGGAMVWGKSPDGKEDLLVAINASKVTMDELVSLVRGLGMGQK